jgi:hypothetical protein
VRAAEQTRVTYLLTLEGGAPVWRSLRAEIQVDVLLEVVDGNPLAVQEHL